MSENFNLDALLSIDLSDLADLPEFENFPAGVHRCTVEIITKTINDKPAAEVKLTGIETVELSSPEKDQPIKPGAVSSAAFILNNEYGQGAFKKLIKPLAEALGTGALGEVIAGSKGMEVEAVTGYRYSKKQDTSYFDIKKLIVV